MIILTCTASKEGHIREVNAINLIGGSQVGLYDVANELNLQSNFANKQITELECHFLLHTSISDNYLHTTAVSDTGSSGCHINPSMSQLCLATTDTHSQQLNYPMIVT